MDQALQELDRKVDAVAEQLAFLTEEARQQQRRRRERDELIGDLTPVASDIFRLSVEQLNEVESYVHLEDVLHLLKRMMRNTRNLVQMLDQLESVTALWKDATPLTQDAFLTLLKNLDQMERKGYFMFLRGGMSILDQIVTSFNQDDIQQLGENVVLILQTVKEMTQPEVMRMMQSTASVIREEDSNGSVSMLAILRQLNDPAVRKGLAKTLTVLKAVSEN